MPGTVTCKGRENGKPVGRVICLYGADHGVHEVARTNARRRIGTGWRMIETRRGQR